jgi:ABC-type transport system substrate-binding protein
MGAQQSTDQYLPPGAPGFRDAHIYPFRPDLSVARRLAGTKQRTAILYAIKCPTCDQVVEILTRNLAAIGIDVVTKKVTFASLLKRMNTSGEPFDLIVPLHWNVDYLDPATHLNTTWVGNNERFDDPSYQRRAKAASRLSGPRRYLAYGALDVDTARNLVPSIPVGITLTRDFLSARMGCRVYQPMYGLDLAALCIRP